MDGHVAAELRHLAHETRGEERVLGGGGHEDGVDPRQALVHLRHLQLVLEVGDGPQALHDDLRTVVACEVDDEALERLDPHVAQVAEGVAEHLPALLQVEARLRLLRVAGDRHDDAVEMARRSLDDVDVAIGDGVEGTRAEGGGHAVRLLVRRSRRSGAYPRTSGSIRRSTPRGSAGGASRRVSITTVAASASTPGRASASSARVSSAAARS